MVHTLLEKTTEFLIKYINAYKAVGANGVLIAEPLAGLLSPGLEEEFSHDYMVKIVEACQTENFLVCYHNCGNVAARQIESITAMGCRMIHFGNAINMADLEGKVPANIVYMGNVDPAGQLRNGTPESVREKTLEVLNACAKNPNFVVSTGCDIPPLSPWENINAFFAAVDEFYGR